jgi:hypothetical protein
MTSNARSLASLRNLPRWFGPITLATVAACSRQQAGAADAGTIRPPSSDAAADGRSFADASAGERDAGTAEAGSGSSLKLIAGVLGGCGNLDGIGSAARLSRPLGVAGDGANLFLVDGNAIRQVVAATGMVTTLAGAASEDGATDGPGATARFWEPGAIASDGVGSLYVGDGYAIRRIAIDSGTVSTLAGDVFQRGTLDGTGSAARFSYPAGVTSDGAGRLFVADGALIRTIDVASGAVSTLGGPASQRITAIAFDRTSDSLLLAVGAAVERSGVEDGVVRTIAGDPGQPGDADGAGGFARFQVPAGIASDGHGHLFVTDQFSNTIRQVDLASGLVTTVAGAPTSTTRYLDGPASNARFLWPMGIVADGADKLFVADSGNCRLRKIDLGTRTVTSFLGPTTSFGDSSGVGSDTFFRVGNVNAMVGDGKDALFMADEMGNVIWRIDAATGAFSALAGSAGQAGSQDGPGPAARFNHPTGITIDGMGSLFVADSANHAIRKIDSATGTVATVAVGHLGRTSAENLLAFPASLAGDGAGNLFVTDEIDGMVCKVVVASGEISILAGSPNLKAPSGITTDEAGSLFVTDARTIRRVEIATGGVTTLAGSTDSYDGPSLDGIGANARFQSLQSVTYDGAGNLYIADGQASGGRSATIRRIAIATGLVTTIAGAAGRVGVSLGRLPATLSAPRGLTYVPKVGLFFVDEGAILLADL